MENLKINVSKLSNDEKLGALNDLVFLGYKKHTDDWMPGRLNECGFYIAYAPPYKIEWDIICMWEDCKNREISIHQLRDLVVLKRNDVKDANYKSATDFYYVTVENQYYFWNGFAWCLSDADFIIGLSPIIDNPENKDPALISGDVALANVHKCIVQYLHDDEPYGRWTTITDHLWSQYHLGMFLDPDTKFKFRFKPQTIKLELELPKPFEPKEGDTFYYLNDGEECGFVKCEHDWAFDPKELNFGAYRTEEEIKQVVEQLRKIKGAV